MCEYRIQNNLIKKEWNYQTICPDEEKTVALLKYENAVYPIKVWKKPNLNSESINANRENISYHQVWAWDKIVDHENNIVWFKIILSNPRIWAWGASEILYNYDIESGSYHSDHEPPPQPWYLDDY